MAKQYTSEEMRKEAGRIGCEYGDYLEVCAMLDQAADTREKIEKEIKRLHDLLTPTCHNCVLGCAFTNGKTHCEKHMGNGSEVELVDKIEYLRRLING